MKFNLYWFYRLNEWRDARYQHKFEWHPILSVLPRAVDGYLVWLSYIEGKCLCAGWSGEYSHPAIWEYRLLSTSGRSEEYEVKE